MKIYKTKHERQEKMHRQWYHVENNGKEYEFAAVTTIDENYFVDKNGTGIDDPKIIAKLKRIVEYPGLFQEKPGRGM